MAPPMKELPRWLLENPEFSIAPDWTDIVKQSVSKKTKPMVGYTFVTTSDFTAPVQNVWKEIGGYK